MNDVVILLVSLGIGLFVGIHLMRIEERKFCPHCLSVEFHQRDYCGDCGTETVERYMPRLYGFLPQRVVELIDREPVKREIVTVEEDQPFKYIDRTPDEEDGEGK
jgi:hypothetical protein